MIQKDTPLNPSQLRRLKSMREIWTDRPLPLVGLTKNQKINLDNIYNKGEVSTRIYNESKSIFQGKEEADYQDRSWIDSKKRYSNSENCYLPNKWIHSWKGHSKGVNKILWFPNTAHLMLSAGLDGKIKIWDVFKDRTCMRTYVGHEKGIRDIVFNKDGHSFVSSCFDRSIKVWDTETGKVKRVIAHKNMCYVLKIHPDEDKQHLLLAGCSDRKIYQYDLNSGDVVQEYDSLIKRHLDVVNTISFVNQNRWFLTTSDDKTIRVWEFGNPEQIKYIADPSMHSIPFVGIVPNNKWLLMQNMDNTILTYGAKDRFSINKKKIFKGHSNAGYACQVGMSPNGHYVLSGDGKGRC